MDAADIIEGARVIDACRATRSGLWRFWPWYGCPASKAVIRRPIEQTLGPPIAAGASQG